MKSTTSTVTISLLILIKFPHDGGCGFLHRCMRKYSWLIYSYQDNGENCLPCVLFARSIDVWKSKGVLDEITYTNFMMMYEVCDLHAARECYKDAIALCDYWYWLNFHMMVVVAFYIGIWESTAGWFTVTKIMVSTVFLVCSLLGA